MVMVRRGVVRGGRGVWLRHVGLADRALRAYTQPGNVHSERRTMYQFLLVDEPFVDLIDVEEVVAGQLAHTIALHEHLEADSTLHLLLHPSREWLIM